MSTKTEDRASRLLRVGLALAVQTTTELSDQDLEYYIEIESALPPLPGFRESHEGLLGRARDTLQRRQTQTHGTKPAPH